MLPSGACADWLKQSKVLHNAKDTMVSIINQQTILEFGPHPYILCAGYGATACMHMARIYKEHPEEVQK